MTDRHDVGDTRRDTASNGGNWTGRRYQLSTENIIIIVVIVLIVLFVTGYFGRGRFRR
jgi:hypothetical protein